MLGSGRPAANRPYAQGAPILLQVAVYDGETDKNKYRDNHRVTSATK
jgi:hypothetical protein